MIGEPLIELSTPEQLATTRQFDKSYGGDAFLTAATLARLGSQPALLTGLGADPFSKDLKRQLASYNINTDWCQQFDKANTGVYMVGREGKRADDAPKKSRVHNSVVYYRQGSAASLIDSSALTEEMIQSVDLVYATGISMAISRGMRELVLEAFTLAKKYEKTTAFDTNYRPDLWSDAGTAFEQIKPIFPFTDIIFPTFPDDSKPLTGLDDPYQTVDFFTCQGIPLVVLKAGKDGCYLGFKRKTKHIGAHPLQTPLKNTIGAGDSFNGGFLHGFLNHEPLVKCAHIGLVTAGLKIQQKDTLKSIPTREAVYSALNSKALV